MCGGSEVEVGLSVCGGSSVEVGSSVCGGSSVEVGSSVCGGSEVEVGSGSEVVVGGTVGVQRSEGRGKVPSRLPEPP